VGVCRANTVEPEATGDAERGGDLSVRQRADDLKIPPSRQRRLVAQHRAQGGNLLGPPFVALLNLVWIRRRGVRVDGGEVELAGDEEEHGAHGGKASVAAGFAFGGLEEAVEGLDEAIGLTGLGSGNDAVEVSADHAGGILHWRDL
jgi:hypothetical protein